MRKGRSQRKSRGSLPPFSAKPLALAAETGAGPQVVIGLTTPPRNEELSSRNDETSTLEMRPSRDSESRARVARRAEPKAVEAEARLEVVTEGSLELAEERLELLQEPTLELAADPTPSDPTPDAEASPPSADPFPSEPLPAPTAKLASPPARGPEPLERDETTDELSIPPMGDLSVEPIAERFFSEGEILAAKRLDEHDEEVWAETVVDKAARKSAPHVVQRRARLSRYVSWAVGGAAIVCLAAFARSVIQPGGLHGAPAAARAAIEATPAARPAEPVVVAAAPEAVQAPKVDVPKSEAPKAEAPKADAPNAAAAEAPAPAVTAPSNGEANVDAKPVSDKTALQEKNDARRALERGKLAESVDAGERSVALDPTDGEAWLLLGAAYQERGKTGEARRCYTACLKQGKRGPLGECQAMLR